MTQKPPVLIWYRRDFRLGDHPALTAAVSSGHPVIPVFLNDEGVDRLAAAPKWRLGLGVAHLAQQLTNMGSRLVLRRGAAQETLLDLVAQTGAVAVYWSRSYEPILQERDADIKSALKASGVAAHSCGGHLLFDPWAVQTKTGGFYRVYSPMWKAVKDTEIADPLPAPSKIAAPDAWPESDKLADWDLGRGMQRGGAIVEGFARVGEARAQDRLAHFISDIIEGYGTTRDQVAVDGTSRLSENLALGEISPRVCWHAGMRALIEGKAGAETFLKELVWREFAYHLLHHTPHITTGNWRPEWDAFPWNEAETPDVIAWKQGRTGLQFVDAAMRELYVTGTMHNRGRMIVASYLTKHLLTHWKVGHAWFEECLIDWDPASNAMGWQWSAGSGPDATPYFRVFNPATQLDKFDPQRAYASRWIAEGRKNPHTDSLLYFDAIPRSWGLAADASYPAPIVAADVGRKRALAAYQDRGF